MMVATAQPLEPSKRIVFLERCSAFLKLRGISRPPDAEIDSAARAAMHQLMQVVMKYGRMPVAAQVSAPSYWRSTCPFAAAGATGTMPNRLCFANHVTSPFPRIAPTWALFASTYPEVHLEILMEMRLMDIVASGIDRRCVHLARSPFHGSAAALRSWSPAPSPEIASFLCGGNVDWLA
jgi:hypothetical protein